MSRLKELIAIIKSRAFKSEGLFASGGDYAGDANLIFAVLAIPPLFETLASLVRDPTLRDRQQISLVDSQFSSPSEPDIHEPNRIALIAAVLGITGGVFLLGNLFR